VRTLGYISPTSEQHDMDNGDSLLGTPCSEILRIVRMINTTRGLLVFRTPLARVVEISPELLNIVHFGGASG